MMTVRDAQSEDAIAISKLVRELAVTESFGFDESHGSLTGAVGMYDHRYHAQNDTRYDPTWHRNHKIIPGYQNGSHVTDLTRDEAVRFIERKRDQPFFLYLPFHAPHTPLDERGEFVDTPTQPDPKNLKKK